MIELTAPGVRAVVSPLDGGRVASLAISGREVLVTGSHGDHPMLWGSFPMAPWAGRIRRGRFGFAGETFEVPTNLPPHALHGTVYERPWNVLPDGSLHIELGPVWPFGGHAVQRFTLTDTSLTCTLEVHAADRPMPAQVGWHPWFRRPVELSFLARAQYTLDDEEIPDATVTAPTAGPWDHCFRDIVEPAVLRWPGGPTITVTSTCDHLVVYTLPEHAVCVEPQSGPPDGFNIAPHTVVPGDPLVASMTLTWG